MNDKPQVGLGVIILRDDGKILVAKRKGSHAPCYSIPGGHLELGEAFEDGAIREVDEEHGIQIHDPKVIAVTNNLATHQSEGLHYISVILLASSFTGTPKIKEPNKCEEILWIGPKHLPEPHFDASRLGVNCWLKDVMYLSYDLS
jgi:8-oxo-dGTP diphosphatase